MTAIYDRPIATPMAWRGEDIASKETFAVDLNARQVSALEDMLHRTRQAGLSLADIRLEQCRHPALDDFMETVLDEILFGRGLVIVRGFPVRKHPVEDIRQMYWILGTHLGRGLSQNPYGDLLTYVRDETPPGARQSARGYLSRRELMLHNDVADIMGLMCCRMARRGGASHFTSALAVHNEILAQRPDTLEILYRGFPYHRRGEQDPRLTPITTYNVPIFSQAGGVVSVRIARHVIDVAMRDLGAQLTSHEEEALDVFMDTAERLKFTTVLEDGEGAFTNDLTVLHARSEFEDWDHPEGKRLMLRLWVDARRDPRPVVPEVFFQESVGGRGGIDAVPGKVPATPDYLIENT